MVGFEDHRLETILLEHEPPPGDQWRWSGGSIPGWTAAFIRVHQDARIDGIAESYFGNFVPEIIPPVVEDLAHHVVGENPFRIIGYLWRKLNSLPLLEPPGIRAKHHRRDRQRPAHLVGKALHLPVYQLL